MLKLKEIIRQLNNDSFGAIEQELVKTKARNFHFLLTSYRNQSKSDEIICKELEITTNAFYALKSRLLDKIQDHLASVNHFEKEDIIKELSKLQEICCFDPRETANIKLQRIEQDLIRNGMHHELLIVYSALKKINQYTTKFYTYSQLYNKQVAYSLSVEKAEETIGQYAKFLGEYILSGNSAHLDTLQFITKEIDNIYEMNPSKPVQLIKNIIHLQHRLFCKNQVSETRETDVILNESIKLLDLLPKADSTRMYTRILNFISFEYYLSIGKIQTSINYAETIESEIRVLGLHSHILCVLPVLQGLLYLQSIREDRKKFDYSQELLCEDQDVYSKIGLSHYKAIQFFYNSNISDSAKQLRKIVNDFSFVNYFHFELEIKLTLVYLLILLKDNEGADDLLKKTIRKLKSSGRNEYQHVEYLYKLFDNEINKEKSAKNQNKKKELLVLFNASNTGNIELLRSIMSYLKKSYQI